MEDDVKMYVATINPIIKKEHRHRYNICVTGNQSIGGYLTPDDAYYCQCGRRKK